MFFLLVLVSINLPYGRLFKERLVIDQETFFITEPVLPDGGVDYRSVLNAMDSENVTPENNAVVKLLEVIPVWDKATSLWEVDGELDIPRGQRELATALGIEALPKCKPTRTSIDFIVDRYLDDRGIAAPEFRAELGNQRSMVLQPWRSAEYPRWGEALEHASQQLDILVEAANRSSFYWPSINHYFVDEQTPISTPFVTGLDLGLFHENGELRMRAMNCIGEGEAEGAIRDIQAMRKLARLMINRPLLTGAHWDAVAADCEQVLLSSRLLSDQQVSDQISFLLGMQPGFDLKKWNLRQRLYTLRMLQTWQKYGSEYRIKDNFGSNPTARNMLLDSSDLLETMRLVNCDFGKIETALDDASDFQILANLRPLIFEASKLSAEQNGLSNRIWSLVKGPVSRGRLLWQQEMQWRFQFVEAMVALKIQSEAEWELSILAHGLERQRIRDGSYPKSLKPMLDEYANQFQHVNSGTNSINYEQDENGFSIRMLFSQELSISRELKKIVVVDRLDRQARKKRGWDLPPSEDSLESSVTKELANSQSP